MRAPYRGANKKERLSDLPETSDSESVSFAEWPGPRLGNAGGHAHRLGDAVGVEVVVARQCPLKVLLPDASWVNVLPPVPLRPLLLVPLSASMEVAATDQHLRGRGVRGPLTGGFCSSITDERQAAPRAARCVGACVVHGARCTHGPRLGEMAPDALERGYQIRSVLPRAVEDEVERLFGWLALAELTLLSGRGEATAGERGVGVGWAVRRAAIHA